MIHEPPGAPAVHTDAHGVQKSRLVKTLRRGDIVLFIVAAVISADSIAVLAAGGPEGLVWSAFIGVAFLVPSAFVFAETSSTYPEEGGPYQWVRRAFGKTWASVAVIMYWITNPIWLGGSLAFIAGSVWSEYVVTTSGAGDFVVKLVFVWVAILLAIVSLKRGKVLINIGAYAKLFVLLSLTVTALVHVAQHGTAGVDWSAATPTAAGFLAIVPVALFAFVGFEAPSAASEEMHDPQKDTPAAIARGAGITLLAYLAPVLAILLVTPADRTADAGVMQAIGQSYSVFGAASGPLLTITGLAFVYALMTQGSAWMIATDRMQAVAAGDGAFFTRALGEFSRRLGTPVRMNVLSGLVGTVFLVAATLLVHGTAASIFGVVLTQAVSTLLISYVVIVPAMIRLRLVDDVPRPYQVPGGRRGYTVLAVVVYAFILLGSIAAVVPGVLESLLGIDYDFLEEWGVSRTSFEVFTVGTLVVVIAAALVGRVVGGIAAATAPPVPEPETSSR
ncbi:APC family permease [Kineococcus rhizosphaerae]|uniref:Amino acid/polyamine/organocation transporter (APC superfamily) n=1 Tax=Kineococcus rhizosphaerae TaxID=559628 RepID=A0A2T0R242_9ACTN|nr:APC family permease [Kineococcus rhizosphaerae]PRY13628.1 amino acid/polyamine/organocation transporter (APC superfamily) [Kineococcus rhizosphaerae]